MRKLHPELIAMVAVIAISSWHVGQYMSARDGWIFATIQGATLGSCNFLMAHNIFRHNSTSRTPSFVGLVFFAVTSIWMQYNYFVDSPTINSAAIWGINAEAFVLGMWAPVAEILLGWVYAAGASGQQLPASNEQGRVFGKLLNAAVDRAVSVVEPARAVEQSTHTVEQPKVLIQSEKQQETPVLQGNSKTDDPELIEQLRLLVSQQKQTTGKLNKSQLARDLGVTRNTVYEMLGNLPESAPKISTDAFEPVLNGNGAH